MKYEKILTGMTVQELISEEYTGGDLNMMTPCGFINLNEDMVEKLRAGNSVRGNPGFSGSAMEIPAEMVLDMVIMEYASCETGLELLVDYSAKQKNKNNSVIDKMRTSSADRKNKNKETVSDMSKRNCEVAGKNKMPKRRLDMER